MTGFATMRVMGRGLSCILRGLATAGLLALPALATGCAHAARPPTPPAASNAITSFVLAQVGKPYCWGGSGPRCFDCSGLTQAAWRHAGVAIPRTSSAQGKALDEVSLDEIRPGDVLWWPGHVGIYVGNGAMVDALNARSGIVFRRVALASSPRALRPAMP